MNFLDMASIRLAVGLVLLIAANIALGSINAIIACEWDLVKFRNGCIKGGVIALALIAVYFAGYLNPDLMVVEVSGQTVNLMTAVSLVMLAAFTAYAVDVIGKLKDMLLTATPGTDQTPAALPEEKTDEAPDAPKEEGPMTAIERVIATARAEIGYIEKATNSQLEDKTANAGSGNWTKYAAFLDGLGVYNFPKNGYAWCDMFVDWCYITTFGLGVAMKMTNQPMGGYGAGCTQSAGYYRAVGRFHKSNPQPGDQIFFTKDGGKSMYHTGLVEKVSGGRVYTIEGNTSSAPGVVPNGGMVRNKSYSINYAQIGGYGTPDWSLVKEEEEMAEITQDKFNEMFKVAMNAYRAELQDNDCGNFSADGRKFVEETGLLVGGSKLPNGEANFMWQDFLTREQFATVLYRFAQKFGLS